MTFEFLQFWLREGWDNVWRNRLMSLLAVATVTMGLFILGFYYIGLANLRADVQQETAKLDLTVMLRQDISAKRRKEIYQVAMNLPQVEHLRVVLRSQALKEWQKKFPDLPLDGFEKNPLEDELHITLRDPGQLFIVRSQLLRLAGVDQARDDTATDRATRNLLAVDRFLTVMGLCALGVLSLAILIIIYNAIRLTVYARRREIRIMELVGATPGFIRVPFLLEGLFYGLTGAVAAALCLTPLYLYLLTEGGPKGFVRSLLPLAPAALLARCSGWMVLCGVSFGLIGSWLSLSRASQRAGGTEA